MKNKLIAVAAAISMSGVVGQSSAATYTFTNITSSQASAVTSPASTPAVTVTAWSSKWPSSNTSDNGTDQYFNIGSTYDSYKGGEIIGAYLSGSGTLQVRSQSESTNQPDHAIDNDEALEAVLIDFGSNYVGSITDFMLSWAREANIGTSSTYDYHSWADVSILAYTGGDKNYNAQTVFGDTTTTFPSLTTAAGGWTQIGGTDFSNVSANSTRATGTTQTSRYWLIGASGLSGTLIDKGADYIKLSKFSATVTERPKDPPPSTGVPEPESLALVGVALAGMLLTRCRKQA
ncbi:MAG: PEP-CTERM sorting domain-containing protein [Burkholderiales bacterium]|nr:PEP-CTERM sorting domain-containing protein [Burkholderiales bacterium]